MDSVQPCRHGAQRKRSVSAADGQECLAVAEHSTLSRYIMLMSATFRRSFISGSTALCLVLADYQFRRTRSYTHADSHVSSGDSNP
jgi:hypothetical protein